MSAIGTSVLKGALGGFASGGFGGVISGALGGLFGGGNGGVNIANDLSRQVGCTITQANATRARAAIAAGINPCTGQPTSTATSFDTGIGPGGISGQLGLPQPVGQPIPVFEAGPGGVPVSTTQVVGNLEFTRTGLIRSVIVNGRRVSRKNAAALIRKQGIEIGARALGLNLTQAAQVVLQQSSRPRRRRGITGRQITEARRVMNTIATFGKALGCTTRRAPARRKSTCR